MHKLKDRLLHPEEHHHHHHYGVSTPVHRDYPASSAGSAPPAPLHYAEPRSYNPPGSAAGVPAPVAAPISAGKFSTATVTIPCHHIRLGDILMLQDRPCQVIRISTSAATGQHRYLGVDLFTKQLHEESSTISNPAPSVVVQTMHGPVLKQYRVLDMQDGFSKL